MNLKVSMEDYTEEGENSSKGGNGIIMYNNLKRYD